MVLLTPAALGRGVIRCQGDEGKTSGVQKLKVQELAFGEPGAVTVSPMGYESCVREAVPLAEPALMGDGGRD